MKLKHILSGKLNHGVTKYVFRILMYQLYYQLFEFTHPLVHTKDNLYYSWINYRKGLKHNIINRTSADYQSFLVIVVFSPVHNKSESHNIIRSLPLFSLDT